MATLIAHWKRMTKRWPLRTAGALGVCLVGVAILAQLPSRTIFLAAARAPTSAIEVAPPAARSTDAAPPHSAAVSTLGRAQVQANGPKAVPTHAPSAASLDLAPSAARRVLTGVTQLALALPEAAGASSIVQPSEDANSRLLRQHFARLQAGREQFSRMAAYTATMAKQERVGGSLLEEVSYGIKVRHQPFSVYMKWQSGDDTGKEVLFVDGIDDGQLLVRLGGLKGRILPAFKVDPFGSLALRQSRYPITKLGILALADTLIERRQLEMRDGIVPRVEQKPDADCGGRPCSVYVFEDSDAQRSPVYRKSIQYIDRQWNVPLRAANFTWPEPGQSLQGPALDEATLIEYYMYSEIVAHARLTDGDFDRSNAEYHFHR
ncbi:MAG TPA: DUF1571 domain-containing protein [Planctomycetaceae bacterium]|jgi:hypothetical protein|nr:DUF1571 domain-containing protein [Planctomycetaceae bacterium]